MKEQIRAASGALLWSCVVLTACGPSEKQKAQFAEEKRVHCLDHFCEGDVVPKKFDPAKEVMIKLNGQWYFSPKQYAKSQGLAFYWPSKTPVSGRPDGQPYPGRGQDFYDVAIEIFLQHQTFPVPSPRGYELLRQAEAQGQLISKEAPRPGLEVWRIKNTDRLRPGVWYVATQLKDFDGQPPVVWCDDNNPQFDRCSTGGLWTTGIIWDTRFRGKHGPDWPEIYQETTRVLQLIRKA